MAHRREAGQVNADLGDDALRDDLADPGDHRQELGLHTRGFEGRASLVLHLDDGGIEGIDLSEIFDAGLKVTV